ncbi:MAG: phosphonate C-P lyase system protein PhnH [Azospirillaceae bacterium]|nr:phosphonate C-P lyase system protein PhnH [Azospirillaceae bacterium]
MTADIDALRPGFENPAPDANAVFRTVLTGFSYPGRILALPIAIAAPPRLNATAAAVLLALADLDAPVWLTADVDTAPLRSWLQFHCGCPLTALREEAVFAVANPDAFGAVDGLAEFAPGRAESPETSTTVIVQVADLRADGAVRLSGPGIAAPRSLAAPPLSPAFWAVLRDNHARFPQGIDVILAAPDRMVCLPRTTLTEG